MAKTAFVVLSEIYGCNEFCDEVQERFYKKGMEVFCPNLLMCEPFPYEEKDEAYLYFMSHVGFQAYKDVDYFLEELQAAYDCVIVLGFSVGATLAWRVSTLGHADAVICCYGSRIRDYLDAEPKCRTMLLFAKDDAFDVEGVMKALCGRENVEMECIPAKHGFLDPHKNVSSEKEREAGWKVIDDFIRDVTEIQ